MKIKGETYNLKVNDDTSDLYYKKVTDVSKRVRKFIVNKDDMFLKDLMNYIEENNIEPLRSKDEYAIEFLMIGVMFSEYGLYTNTLNKSLYIVFKFLLKLREKESLKNKVDNIKGYLIRYVLCNRANLSTGYNINNLILWMAESGDFKEEVYRLKNWKSFLKDKSNDYNENFIKETINSVTYMEKVCEESLAIFLEPLEKFLDKADKRYEGREDFIYCTKGRKQYYFNMISAQIMNEVYREEFLKCSSKKIFAPACMRQLGNRCRAIKGDFGYECRQCNKSCNINKLSELVKDKKIDVHTIPHETVIDKLAVDKKDKIGIIGIACLTNLMSGGWKALRLGFIPQCVILDYCGCEKHWLTKGKMTSINKSYLLNLIS